MAHRAPLSPKKQLRALFRDAHHIQRAPSRRRAVLGDQIGHQSAYGDKGPEDPKQKLSSSTQRRHTPLVSTSHSKTPRLPRLRIRCSASLLVSAPSGITTRTAAISGTVYPARCPAAPRSEEHTSEL